MFLNSQTLGRSWNTLGCSRDAFGPSKRLEFRSPCSHHVSELSNSCALLKHSRMLQGCSGAGDVLDTLLSDCVEFQAFLANFRMFWVSSCDFQQFSAILAYFQRFWATCSDFGQLRTLLGALGRSWDALGTLLGRYLKNKQLEHKFWAPTWVPKSSQVGSKILKKCMSKRTLILKRFVLVFFIIFIDFHVKAKIVDFMKYCIFPKENHVFLEFRILWGPHFLNTQPFLNNRFRGQKTFQNWGQNPLKSI